MTFLYINCKFINKLKFYLLIVVGLDRNVVYKFINEIDLCLSRQTKNLLDSDWCPTWRINWWFISSISRIKCSKDRLIEFLTILKKDFQPKNSLDGLDLNQKYRIFFLGSKDSLVIKVTTYWANQIQWHEKKKKKNSSFSQKINVLKL